MTYDLTRDPERDPRLAALLGASEPEIDWDGLRGRISAQAELPLARRRRGRSGRPVWVRSLLPLAAAAGIAGAALGLDPGGTRASALSAEEQAMVNEIAESALPGDLAPLLSGQAAQEALLEAVAGS
jgi:hypothetical protein